MKSLPNDGPGRARELGSDYRAIILAAGSGRRLLPYTIETPKCLVDIDGTTILEQQLSLLEAAGIEDIVIVTGFEEEQTRASASDSCSFVNNPRFSETNSAYSLWLAREFIEGPCLVLNSDVLFGWIVLEQLLLHPFPDVIAYDSGSHLEHEETKVRVGVHGRLGYIGKEIHPRYAQGEHLGLIRLSNSGSKTLARNLDDAVVGAGRANDWVPDILHGCLADRPVFGVDVVGDPWIEVDMESDLLRARSEVYPRILCDAGGINSRASLTR